MGKKINQLTSVSDATAADDIQLFALANPATGISGKMTVGQGKKAFGTFKKKYVATGSEGTTLTIAELADMEIVMATREGGVMYEVTATPDTTEFIFDGTDITLGLAVAGAGERFQFLYKNPA